MTKPIIALLSILMIYVLQVFAQNCVLTEGPYSNQKKVVVKVNNTGFYPDCFIVRDGQSVVWKWEEEGDHTVTSNAGPFGDCNDEPSPVLDVDDNRLYMGDEIYAGPFKYDPDNPLNNEFYYKCYYHCGSGMFGMIQIIKKKR
ncbi:hypothetical protein RclHR1_05630003 [Rhizophagus clarus]|uniref:Blue (type 1) copper domain-containing protein n=1 Tax=Rhizophagus clarus TaxID=94130 RepID=A0A2Z6RNJ2_9GLOM|nr:hypothetical protein RclHR1_05630003 [Rhizophagus clarus]GES91817.1 hypothetical protein GLOIN_2v1880946 [Rhizophagus clarus]